jgi:hypothetical protein
MNRPSTWLVGVSMLFLAPLPARAQTAKAAEAAVAAANARVVTELPFADRQDFDDAMRGFIAMSPDECTGSMTLFILPLGVTAHLDFVIDDDGAEVRAIATGPGTK